MIKNIILGIETATNAPSISLFRDGTEKDFSVLENNGSTSTMMLSAIADLLNRNRLKLNDAEYLAVSVGPGSFTGIRVGAAIAKGLVKGAKLKPLSIITTEAIAYSAQTDGEISVVVSSGRTEFFVAKYLFRKNSLRCEIISPGTFALQQILEEGFINDSDAIVCDGKAKDVLQDKFSSANILLKPSNLAEYVCVAALHKLPIQEFANESEMFRPHYSALPLR